MSFHFHVFVVLCFCAFVHLHSVLPRHSDTQSQHLAKNNLDDVQTQNCPLVAPSRDPRATQPERCTTRTTEAQWMVSRCGKGRRGERPASPHVPCKCIHNNTATRNCTQILHRLHGRTNDWRLVFGHHRGTCFHGHTLKSGVDVSEEVGENAEENIEERAWENIENCSHVSQQTVARVSTVLCRQNGQHQKECWKPREHHREAHGHTPNDGRQMWWNAAAHLIAPMHIT